MCNYRNIIIEDHQFYQIILNLLAVLEIPLYILGAYIIIWKTPKSMLPVKTSMLLLHFTCVWHDMCLCVLVVPFMIFPAGAGISLGILFKIGTPLPLIIYIGVTTVFLVAPAIVFFFEDRYNTLVRQDSQTHCRKVKRIIFHTINYLYVFVALLPTLVNVPNQDEAKALTLMEFPCLPPDIVNIPGFYRVSDNVVVPTISCMSVNFVAFVQVAFFFVATSLKTFNMKTTSKRTYEMQKHLFKCLCIQVIIPIVIIFVPCSYAVGLAATSHLDQAANNIACILVTSYGALSTISMLVIHKPYRLAVLKFFRIPKLSSAITDFQRSETTR